MVKDHSNSEKGNPLPPHRLLFPINSKGSFICSIAHTTAFVTPVVDHWLEREIAKWVYPMKDPSDPNKGYANVSLHVRYEGGSAMIWRRVRYDMEEDPL